MLTKPEDGWTEFHLDETYTYPLSYLDDLAFEWLDQAIHGLKTMLPFCVKGFMEPDRFLCVVSFWNCHIICEPDGRERPEDWRLSQLCSHTSMLEFCEALYEDLSAHQEEWVNFQYYRDYDADTLEQRREALAAQLAQLRELIERRRRYFDQEHCFL